MTDWSRWLGPDIRLSETLELVRAFQASDPLVEGSLAELDGDAWRVRAEEGGFLARLLHRGQSVPLFEVTSPKTDDCLLVYGARVRAEELKGRAYLEMWCRLPNGDFFSKGNGFEQLLEGPSDWTTLETPFLLKKRERPDRVRLNLAVEGSGTVWIKDVELLSAPLEHPQEPS